MPLALTFVLIGFFLWIAENAATYAGAWSCPDQLDGWQPVSPAKFGAWALLISVTFVLAAAGRWRAADRSRPDGSSEPAPLTGARTSRGAPHGEPDPLGGDGSWNVRLTGKSVQASGSTARSAADPG